MPGGTFDRLVSKIRPGTYINFESARGGLLGRAQRGTVLLPLINHSYGPEKEFITLDISAPDAQYKQLGFSIFDKDPAMLLIRETFKNAAQILVYIPRQGAKAIGTIGSLSMSAVHGGSRGNELTVTITENTTEGFDVSIFLGSLAVYDYFGVETVADLIAEENGWIKFTGAGDLEINAGTKLTGGTNGIATNGDIATFIETSESHRWNTMAFPMAVSGELNDPVPALLEMVVSKIKYLRESAGKYRKAVISGHYADYEGVINVTNGVELNDGTQLDAAQVTAWVAGIDAAATNTQSNTHRVYAGAVNIIGYKNDEASTEAIRNGEFFFTFNEDGEVIVQYDINSLTTLTEHKDNTYKKNRTIRVFDSFSEWIKRNLPPNKFDNSKEGWDIMEGIGRAGLREFGPDGVGAIKNIDYEADFRVDRTSSTGDDTYFDVGLEPMESSEKMYFTVVTR